MSMIPKETDTPVFSKPLKILAGTVGPIGVILGGFWAIDSHYASAQDLQVMQRSVETQVRTLRIERTEDELFKLDMKRSVQKGKLSPEDEALYQRYTRKLSETNKEQRSADAADVKSKK
jgi:hypothetical protein